MKDAGHAGIVDTVRAQFTAAEISTAIITGADHFYSGRVQEVADVLAGWADAVARPEAPASS